MRRYLFFALILFIIAGVFFMAPERQAPSGEDPYSTLHRLMQFSGAELVEGEFHYWASLGKCPQITSLPDLEAKADALLALVARGPAEKSTEKGDSACCEGYAQPLPVEDGICHALYRPASRPDQENNPTYMVVEKFADLPHGERLRLLLQRMEQDGENIVHLLITVNQEGEAMQLGSMAYRLSALLEPQAEKGNLTFCLTGHLPGELSPADMQELMLDITRSIGGEQVQSTSDGKMISVTGYTPDLGDFLKAENLRINLNLAIRYDEYLDKTVIWAGTPIISRYY